VKTTNSSVSKYCSTSRWVSADVRGVTSDALITTLFPAASAAMAGWIRSVRGKFHVPITPTTPNG
jgi:hypothetical protein